MAYLAPSRKAKIATALTAVFFFFLATTIGCAASPKPGSKAAAFSEEHTHLIVIRDSGNGGNFCSSIKLIAAGSQLTIAFTTLVTEPAPKSLLTVSPILRNVFYVFISSLAP